MHLKFLIKNGIKTNYILKMFENEVFSSLDITPKHLIIASQKKINKITIANRVINKISKIC